jgi:4-amino-4-deoxy-L-arabinose transferase-like glycosyltransferase
VGDARARGDGPPPLRSVVAVCLLAGFGLFGAVGRWSVRAGQAAAGAAAVLLGEREGTPDSL